MRHHPNSLGEHSKKKEKERKKKGLDIFSGVFQFTTSAH